MFADFSTHLTRTADTAGVAFSEATFSEVSRMDPRLPPPFTGELIVPLGPGAGSRCPLNVPLVRVGRSARCGLRLDADGVDSVHCVIALSADGPLLHDLDSAAGVSVNGVRVE